MRPIQKRVSEIAVYSFVRYIDLRIGEVKGFGVPVQIFGAFKILVFKSNNDVAKSAV